VEATRSLSTMKTSGAELGELIFPLSSTLS
jgi:hypothetical protein